MSHLTTSDISRGALFAALTAAGAFVVIPFGPVPITLQVFFILLGGMMLGSRLAALSAVAYLTLGLVAPVYAGGASGVGVLFGPTGGYLLSFVPAALISGWLARRRDPTLGWLLLAGVVGLTPIYVLGTVWLGAQLHMTASAALSAGVLPFIAGDATKAVLAAVVARMSVRLPVGLPVVDRDH